MFSHEWSFTIPTAKVFLLECFAIYSISFLFPHQKWHYTAQVLKADMGPSTFESA